MLMKGPKKFWGMTNTAALYVSASSGGGATPTWTYQGESANAGLADRETGFRRQGIAHDSVDPHGAQIIDPLGHGTAPGYNVSWVWISYQGRPVSQYSLMRSNRLVISFQPASRPRKIYRAFSLIS
jgi:hypothetical protein